MNPPAYQLLQITRQVQDLGARCQDSWGPLHTSLCVTVGLGGALHAGCVESRWCGHSLDWTWSPPPASVEPAVRLHAGCTTHTQSVLTSAWYLGAPATPCSSVASGDRNDHEEEEPCCETRWQMILSLATRRKAIPEVTPSSASQLLKFRLPQARSGHLGRRGTAGSRDLVPTTRCCPSQRDPDRRATRAPQKAELPSPNSHHLNANSHVQMYIPRYTSVNRYTHTFSSL